VVEVQLPKQLDVHFASTALEIAGFVPAPTIEVIGNPAPSAALKISNVTEPLGEHIAFHPISVPPLTTGTGSFVPVPNKIPSPLATNVTF